LPLFFALNVGKIVEVEPLVACNPLLILLWTAIFLRGIERLSRRIIISAIATVAGHSSRNYSSLKTHPGHCSRSGRAKNTEPRRNRCFVAGIFNTAAFVAVAENRLAVLVSWLQVQFVSNLDDDMSD
jgi:hypothetical protein